MSEVIFTSEAQSPGSCPFIPDLRVASPGGHCVGYLLPCRWGSPPPLPPCVSEPFVGRLLSLPLQQTAVSLFLTWIDFALCFVTNDAENHVPRDPPCRAAP